MGRDEEKSAATNAPRGEQETPVVETKTLTRKFGELVAVDEVSLTFERGEFRSIIGPNGAGKTTLFNCITGALSPSSGRVLFQGTDVTDLPPHERVRHGMGRSFQITNVFPGLSVRENVRLAAQAIDGDAMAPHEWLLRSKDGFEDIEARTDGVLREIGLAERGAARASALAYGDRRRLEIGLVLATDPEIVLLDEPTAGMSPEETSETLALVDDVLADRTLLLIEHDVDLVMNISDRITVLNRGAELATGTPAEIADDEAVQRAYMGGLER